MVGEFTKIDPISGTDEEKILLKDFTPKFRSGYVNVTDGNVTMPQLYTECSQKIFDFNIRDDDVFVTSFPKTGTTWTQEMVWLIGNDLDYEGAKQFLPARFPFLEHTPLFDYRDFIKTHSDFDVPSYVIDSVEFINNMPSPRYIKSHLPFDLLPDQIVQNIKKPKIIYVWRNVKDCLVSYYNHCVLLEGYKGTFDDFFKLFLANKLSFTPFWPHVVNFWKNKDKENVLFLSYEEMKADLLNVVKKVATFMNKKYSDEEYSKLVEHLSFENMKNNPAVNYEIVTEMNRKSGLITAEGNFMRSGTVGNFKVHMTPEQIKQIDEWTKEQLKNTGFNP